MTVAAGELLVRGGLAGFGSAFDVKAVNVRLPPAEVRRLLSPGGGEDFFPVTAETEGVIVGFAGEPAFGGVIVDEEGLPPGGVGVVAGEALSRRHGRVAVGARELLPVVTGETEIPDCRLVKLSVEAVAGVAAAEEEGAVTPGAEERGRFRTVGIMAGEAGDLFAANSPVGPKEAVVAEVVAPAAESVPLFGEDQPLLVAVVKVTGGALPAPEGGVDAPPALCDTVRIVTVQAGIGGSRGAGGGEDEDAAEERESGGARACRCPECC